MKLHITNGNLIDPKNKINGLFDLVIENGKVSQVLKAGQKIKDATVIDAKGCIVSPGFIDLHTHLREPGFEYKETIQSGTHSAAAGGFTSVCCMANTSPVNDHAAITEYILKQAREKGVVNVYPIGAVTKNLDGKELAEIGELKKAGCVALSDDGKCVENARLQRLAMEYITSLDLPIITHSIDPCLSAGGVMNEGIVSTKLGLPGVPNEAEDYMIARDIYISQLANCRLHVAHVSTREGVELVKRAKQKGLKVTCEVCPHHFTLTEEDVASYDTNAKMAPPLRSTEDKLALIAGLADGTIDAIATDHAPHAPIDKEIEFECAACGVVGLETALALSLKLVDGKKITLERIIECLTINPAKVVSLQKGSLEVGADADITIFNAEEGYNIDASTFKCKSKNSPFNGMKVKGVIKSTIVGGKIVFDGKNIVS